MGVEGKACVDLDSRLRAAWAGNSDILWSRKEIVPTKSSPWFHGVLILGKGDPARRGPEQG